MIPLTSSLAISIDLRLLLAYYEADCVVFFRGHSKMVSILLKQKADPDCSDIEGNTPLHMACEEDRREVAEILVENDADITSLNKVYTV